MILSQGLLAESIPDLSLRSLTPFGNSFIWENYFSQCPVLSSLRGAFNPIVMEGGSSKIQYVNNWWFFMCVQLEKINYEYLSPMGLFTESLNRICN